MSLKKVTIGLKKKVVFNLEAAGLGKTFKAKTMNYGEELSGYASADEMLKLKKLATQGLLTLHRDEEQKAGKTRKGGK